MEAHICVLQSALGLQALGFAPVVVADAVASRQPASREIALQRLQGHGIEIVTAEMVVLRVAARGRHAGLQGDPAAGALDEPPAWVGAGGSGHRF